MHDVVHLAVELFGDFHLGFRSLDVDAVQMKRHVLHFPWVQGVVPGVLVAGCRSFDRTGMSRMLVCLVCVRAVVVG